MGRVPAWKKSQSDRLRKARLKKELKVKKHPELIHIVDYVCEVTKEVFLQLSIRTWNDLIQKTLSNAFHDFSLMQLKHSISFTKDIIPPQNVLKPFIEK
ncbi:Oidioi.mRNA.OKI2018_I69.chr2.g5818.t1.cds [Oikopleura dioica]|uniref:Oidioi.mRNA.OKI2018_I69.chr2.g5818.t1.cds n=1 Tax=Oikopleura dioica TaxID=34765 RepID=A0ABN7T217_OIKDI|nr:Oidioi.mRNA.OKI2018_I69.chr2.g5818.t1.cds [Oikopleura dioica]